MLREIIEGTNYELKYSTTPNGHFGGTVSLTKKEFDKALKMETTSPRTENGFNTYRVDGNTLTLGYNHSDIWKEFI